MEQSGGQIAAKLAKPRDGGEDRLSALPDEVLVLILECLDTKAEAVRTSVLARRWPRIWLLLSKLRFELSSDGNRIRKLLEATDATELRYISVTTKEAAADSAMAWLTAALSTTTVLRFEKATMIELYGIELCRLGSLLLPSVGVFTQLTDLSLWFIDFCGPCELGTTVSSP